MLNDIKEILYSEGQLQQICENLGKQISEDYKDKNLLLVSVLKGSIVFMADLMRNITVPCEVDFMSVSSYGNKTTSSGNVRIKLDLGINLEGYDLLLVEDILDSGKTLFSLRQLLSLRKPNSIR